MGGGHIYFVTFQKRFLAHTMALRALLGMKRTRSLIPGARSFTEISQYAKAWQLEQAHASKTYLTWKRMSIFVVVPAIAWCIYNTISLEKVHKSHPRDEFLPYEHLRIRNKPFPWKDGNHSLFHNPLTNALPDGYEDM